MLILLCLLLVTVSTFDANSTKRYILVFAVKTTNRNCLMVGDQQAINPPHIVNRKVTSAAHGVPPSNGHVIEMKADTMCQLLIPVSSAPRSAFGCYRSGV